MMYLLNLQCVLVLLGSIILSFPGKGIPSEGYRSVIRYKDGFIASGTGGRIDRISVSGKLLKSEVFPGESFNCMLSDDQMIIAAGDNGTILIAPEGEIFRKIESCTDKNINSLTLFNKKIIAGCDQGEIISGDAGGFREKTHLEVKGNIVSVSAGKNDCFGVTDEGEIIHSSDGISWDIFDFNEFYAGFYEPCHFTRVLVTDNHIALAGIRNDGSPVLMFSSGGKVWTERKLNYTDEQGMQGFLQESPCDIFYFPPEEQFFLVFGKGKLMELMPCPHCNDLAVIAEEDLTGISGNENTLMIVGDNFYIKALNLR
jgi:hypothetical protein